MLCNIKPEILPNCRSDRQHSAYVWHSSTPPSVCLAMSSSRHRELIEGLERMARNSVGDFGERTSLSAGHVDLRGLQEEDFEDDDAKTWTASPTLQDPSLQLEANAGLLDNDHYAANQGHEYDSSLTAGATGGRRLQSSHEDEQHEQSNLSKAFYKFFGLKWHAKVHSSAAWILQLRPYLCRPNAANRSFATPPKQPLLISFPHSVPHSVPRSFPPQVFNRKLPLGPQMYRFHNLGLYTHYAVSSRNFLDYSGRIIIYVLTYSMSPPYPPLPDTHTHRFARQ